MTHARELSDRQSADAARGCIVKFSGGRRFVIRSAEFLLFPLVRFVDFFRKRQKKPTEQINNILVLEGGNLGDIVYVLPFLQGLRRKYPDARIAFAANPSMFPLLENLDLVDELIPLRVPWAVHFSQWKRYNPFSGMWYRLFRTLMYVRGKRFDVALSGRGDFRDNFVLWLTGIERRVGYGFLGGGFLMTELVKPDLNRVHRADCWLQLLEHLERPVWDRQPVLKLSEEERNFADGYLSARGIGTHELILGIHPGARIATRQWGEDNFRAVGERLAKQFSAKILWFQDPSQGTLANVPADFVLISAHLRQFMALLNRCAVLICNDSGPMHIASALKIPTVAVFGPTVPAWFGPLGEGHRIVIHPSFWCRPCADRCIFDQPYCLKTIPVEQVLAAAVESVQNLQAGSGDVQDIDVALAQVRHNGESCKKLA